MIKKFAPLLIFLSLLLSLFDQVFAFDADNGSKDSPLIVTKTTIVDFSRPQSVVEGSVFAEVLKGTLQKIVEEEKGGSSKSPTTIGILTKKEAEIYLKEAALTYLADREGKMKEELLQRIFSERHFPNAVPSINDILTLAEKDLYQVSNREGLLGSIFNSRENNGIIEHDRIALEKYRIDPRFFLLSTETVRKWYYTKYHTYEMMTPEDYEKADKKTLRPALFSKHFNFPTNPEERPAYYRTHPVSFLTQEMISNIFSTARRILSQVTSEDRIIIFGNTPYFVGRALNHLIAQPGQKKQPKVIYLPFSGSPNTSGARNAFSYQNDFVTSERLDHFRARLCKLGLMSDNPFLQVGTTYFVDVIGSGGGPAYTMETILRDFQKNRPGIIPNFEVISLNTFKEDEERHHLIASHFAQDGERLELCFPSKTKTRFKVPAQVIFLEGHWSLDFVPDQCPATRIVPEYNPKFWSPEYDSLLTAPLSFIGKILLEHFDENLKALVESHSMAQI